MSSADVWEAVHRATGLDIVADSYTRAYPAPAVTLEHAPLFDALCRVGDSLGMRWKTEDHFLLCRSSSYFWDRLIEVPSRLLVRWQADRKRNDGLPLEDLLEIASLSDQQLAAATNSYVIEHCWGIEEWSIVSSNGPLSSVGRVAGSYLRPYARFLAALTPGERERVLRPEGLLVSILTRAQQVDLTKTILAVFSDLPQSLPQLRMRVDYAPAGGYLWHPTIPETVAASANAAWSKWPVGAGKSPEAMLAATRRYDPAAVPGDIRPSLGALNVVLMDASGPVWQYGGPAVAIRDPSPAPAR